MKMHSQQMQQRVFDEDGYDQNGYNWQGFNRDGFDKEGFDREGFNQDGYNQAGEFREQVVLNEFMAELKLYEKNQRFKDRQIQEFYQQDEIRFTEKPSRRRGPRAPRVPNRLERHPMGNSEQELLDQIKALTLVDKQTSNPNSRPKPTNRTKGLTEEQLSQRHKAVSRKLDRKNVHDARELQLVEKQSHREKRLQDRGLRRPEFSPNWNAFKGAQKN